MEAVLSRLRGLSADELREEFARADVKCGPITATTRATFERKLARVLAGSEGSTTEPDSGSSAASAASVVDTAKPVSCASAAAPLASAGKRSGGTENDADEMDFGYGMGLNPPEEDEIAGVASSHSSVESSNSQPKTETPSKPAQVSPTFFYGVCPPWDDVLSRNGKMVASVVFI